MTWSTTANQACKPWSTSKLSRSPFFFGLHLRQPRFFGLISEKSRLCRRQHGWTDIMDSPLLRRHDCSNVNRLQCYCPINRHWTSEKQSFQHPSHLKGWKSHEKGTKVNKNQRKKHMVKRSDIQIPVALRLKVILDLTWSNHWIPVVEQKHLEGDWQESGDAKSGMVCLLSWNEFTSEYHNISWSYKYLAKLEYFTNLGFPEIRGFPLLNHHLGWKLVWGRCKPPDISISDPPPSWKKTMPHQLGFGV